MRYSAHGTKLQIGDGASPEVFTTVAHVRDISGPGLSTNMIDATDHDSDGFAEKLAGIRDGGQVTFDVAYDPAHATHNGETGMLGDWMQGTRRNLKVVFPDAGDTSWQFTGIMQAFSPSAPVDGLLTASVTIEITGKPELG